MEERVGIVWTKTRARATRDAHDRRVPVLAARLAQRSRRGSVGSSLDQSDCGVSADGTHSAADAIWSRERAVVER